MLSKFKESWAEIRSMQGNLKIFLVCAMLCGFCINAEYALVRPISNSLFIHVFGSSLFPVAWLLTIPLNFACISFYNFFLTRWGCRATSLRIIFFILSANLLFAFLLPYFPSLSIAFYIWKEVYIMLLFQQLWSLIHSNFDLKKASALYGLIFGVGGLGGVCGSLIPGLFAVQAGSEALLYCSAPLCLGMAFFYALAARQGVLPEKEITKQKPSLKGIAQEFQFIFSSKVLFFILAIVVFMQCTSTLIDYQFSTVLENTILQKDLRTEYFGKTLAIMQGVMIFLQFIGTFVLVNLLGLRALHCMIPLALACNAVLYLTFPAFEMIAFSYIIVKSFDFSLFGITKEMLYVPLPSEAKFRSKSVIDVFAYRSAKTVASFLILLIQAVMTGDPLFSISVISIAIFISWSLLAHRSLRPEGAIYS